MKSKLSFHIQWEKINLLLNVVELFSIQPKVIKLLTVRQGSNRLAFKASSASQLSELSSQWENTEFHIVLKTKYRGKHILFNSR